MSATTALSSLEPASVMQMNEAKVIATGPGRRSAQTGEVIPVAVKEGDTVLLPEYGGQTIKMDSKECALATSSPTCIVYLRLTAVSVLQVLNIPGRRSHRGAYQLRTAFRKLKLAAIRTNLQYDCRMAQRMRHHQPYRAAARLCYCCAWQ